MTRVVLIRGLRGQGRLRGRPCQASRAGVGLRRRSWSASSLGCHALETIDLAFEFNFPIPCGKVWAREGRVFRSDAGFVPPFRPRCVLRLQREGASLEGKRPGRCSGVLISNCGCGRWGGLMSTVSKERGRWRVRGDNESVVSHQRRMGVPADRGCESSCF